MTRGLAIAALVASHVACAAPAPAAAPPVGVPSVHDAPAASAPAPPRAPAAPLDDRCDRDDDCRYDAPRGRCGADPRANRQPPVVDQGIVCYCDEARRACATFRVEPVPCEGDASCAVDPSPRPHPVRASAAHPHERGKRCRDFTIATTCERTNICTMHRLECPR